MDLEALTTHLSRLDHAAALALVERLRADGASLEGIVTGLLSPALVEVGRRWAANEIGAAEALAASAIARAVIPRAAMPSNHAGQGSVAVCCPPGEHHEIPSEMLTELLRASGVPAHHLGAGVTPKHLPGFLNRQRPSALLISCTSPCGLPGAARSIEVAHAYGVPVIVGGAAFGRDAMLALRLGAAAWAPSARHVVGILDSWQSRPVTLRPARALSEEYLMFEAGLPDIRAGVVASLRLIAGDSDGDDAGGVADTQDRLELMLRYLGAALLVDDGRLFLDFLSWRAEYYQHRDIGPDRLANGLTALSAALPGEFHRARRFVDEGCQHVSWLVRSGAEGSLAWSGSNLSVTEDIPVGGPGPGLPSAAGPGRAVPAVGSGPAGPGGQWQGARLDDAAATSAAPAPVRPIAAPEQPGRVFADLLFVAATTCHAPFALISVAQPDGRWSTLSHGVERRDLLADDRLFALVGRAAEAVEISDLALNRELASGPMARGPLGIRSMYGIPLRNRQGTLLGVLCVLDKRPRELSARERQALTAVARQVAGQLAMWRRSGSAPLSPPTARPSGAPAAGGERPERSGRLDRQELVASAVSSERPRLHVHREASDELLRSHEVAVLFDVTDRTVINWAAAHKLPSIRTAGGHLRFRGDDVLALLSGHAAGDGRSA